MDIVYKEFPEKSQLYGYIQEQLKRIGEETADVTAILANTSALLKLELSDVNWAGFYLLKDGRLVLGPFQGKPAVAEIQIGAGVCGTAVKERQIQRVEDVHYCRNHIACDLATASEIVVPITIDGEIWGVMDIDSPVPARFDEEDSRGLACTAHLLAVIVSQNSTQE